MKTDKDYRREIKNLENKVTDMNVVIETLQHALQRAKVSIGEHDKDYVFNQSAKWAVGWGRDQDYDI